MSGPSAILSKLALSKDANTSQDVSVITILFKKPLTTMDVG